MNPPDTTQRTSLRCAAALSTAPDLAQALDDVCRRALDQLQGTVDLAALFVSTADPAALDRLTPKCAELLRTKALIGCTAEAILCDGQEIESGPAVSLWVAQLPATTVRSMHLTFGQTQEGGTFTGWPDDLPEPWPADSALLLLADPFSFPADELIERINEDRPGVPVLGGMAASGRRPGENRVLVGGRSHAGGAAAVLIHGGTRVRSVVSQGCRPIGRHFVVTKAEANVIRELSGLPALARLQEVFQELTPQEQALARQGMHVGRVLSEYQDHFGRGDFLVRNVIGADPSSGAIAVGDLVRPGQTVQFHIRDAETADEDLRELLRATESDAGSRPAGALVFTCNGRGTRLFGLPHHDVGCVRDCLGEIPMAGFFAQGELGPVSGKNFLHGFTASIALFEPK